MLSSFQFAEPLWLWLFLPIGLLMYGLWRNRKMAQEQAGEGVIAAHLAKVFSMQNSHRATKAPIGLTLLTASFIIFALAGPSWLKASDDDIKAPLIIALDLSPSMLKSEGSISHLERAKLLVSKLLMQGSSRPISLVAFAGSSHQVLPPSDQFALLTLYLGYMSPQVMPVEGDDIDSLIAVIAAIPDAQEFGFDLLVLSDGFAGQGQALAKFTQKQHAQVLFAALTASAESSATQLGFTVMTADGLLSGNDNWLEQVSKLEQAALSQSSLVVNQGYWLLYPAALLLLLFFRRGFSLYWASSIVLCVSLMPVPVHAQWLDLFFSADQQGQYYYDKGDYQEAALRFEDPSWKARAYYQAKEYSKAAKIYRQQDDLQSLFNLAMTYTRGRNYSKAKTLYQLLLDIEPDFPGASKNLQIVTQLIKDIKQLGESQQEENPPESINPDDMTDMDLGADKPQMGKIEVELQQLSVEELLNSDTKKQQWLRDISKDPQKFLAAKFQAQYNESQQEDRSLPPKANSNADAKEEGND
ncbi:hypothetical protein CXF83_16975 [Shewanella sp. Choline-02u-19]|uniref:vWA domain-containing protein n=1 Tax=unclassified Shewanella TaxID=196818 RepID=UPI000C338A39|nr:MULTISPECIES: hypothetical protein [unclassified Shewanella]PKH57421.1 hypothetical protein CXF84_08930 [Shewanella sp. Bg11-22]PKI28278.1 hypothetical protein CXF83_16975 [Shewanella sp. Choline-02u-19]